MNPAPSRNSPDPPSGYPTKALLHPPLLARFPSHYTQRGSARSQLALIRVPPPLLYPESLLLVRFCSLSAFLAYTFSYLVKHLDNTSTEILNAQRGKEEFIRSEVKSEYNNGEGGTLSYSLFSLK